MPKVIRKDNLIAEVGFEDGTLEEFHLNEFNYDPKVGDEVTVYRGSQSNTIVLNDQKVDASDIRDIGEHVKRNLESEYKNKRKVNKLAYALLAIFLGGLGIHKFYTNDKITGVIMLLFCWTGIPSIIGFVQGILALLKTDDGEGNIYI